MQAAAHIVHACHRTDIHVAVVGSGSELASVRCLASKLRVDEYFTFTGRVSDEMLIHYLNTADICVNIVK